MRTIVANWKLYLTPRESAVVARRLMKRLPRSTRSALTVVLPSTSALAAVADVVRGTRVKLGSQNIDLATSGAATGQVSARDAKELGCAYALVGHSERRKEGETDALIKEKLGVAADEGLTPILCVGETARQRKAGAAIRTVVGQLKKTLTGWQGGKLVVAYEPVWAISKAGRGAAASPDVAFAMARVVRAALKKLLKARASRVHLLYGGSVTARTVRQYVDGTHFQGALVGFASTKADECAKMVAALL